MKGSDSQMTLTGLELVELRAALAEERAAREAMDRRLAETAHDLRAALASVVGYAHMLEEDADDSFTPRELAQRIARLAQGLCEISSELVGPGRSAEAPRTSTRALLAQSAEAIEPQCREKGLRLRVELPSADDSLADRASIQRIVHNLLTNAVRYTEAGEIRVRGEVGEHSVCIEVADTGIGIAAENLGRIFDEYARLEPARRMAPLGTGLGLATVKRLCTLLGGSVEVESTLGRGSVFRVRIPRRTRRRRQRVAQEVLL